LVEAAISAHKRRYETIFLHFSWTSLMVRTRKMSFMLAFVQE